MKKKIMIADDNQIIQILLQEYLQNDFEVQCFNDGNEILQSLNDGNIPDLILADINMPIMDGWSLLSNLKMSMFFKNIPVMILSGIEKSNERIKFLKAGAEDYMVKPFSPEELRLKLLNISKHYNYEID
ncbi:MAG: PleD family two-component system response regulator [Flavobacteriia bacterium]|jgi:DNA-binding response OmpR family regulator